MEKNFQQLHKCPLFAGIDEKDLFTLLSCLSATEKHYHKNEYIFMPGDRADKMGIVLEGKVHVVQEDFWGNRTILTSVSSGGLFGEAFASAEIAQLPLGVIAVEEVKSLLINYRKIIDTCPSVCSFHSEVIRNMLRILAQKNLILTQKIDHISKKTIAEKLQSYLSFQAHLQGSSEFDIPFSRQELAEYLNVDRSALSRELSRMQQQGLLNYHKSHFQLTDQV